MYILPCLDTVHHQLKVMTKILSMKNCMESSCLSKEMCPGSGYRVLNAMSLTNFAVACVAEFPIHETSMQAEKECCWCCHKPNEPA